MVTEDNKNVKYDIKYDSVFKSIFGKIENEKYTKRVIELITGIEVEKIDVGQDVTIERVMVDEKVGILDVRAVVNDSIIVNIEMQREDKGNIEIRSEKYGAEIYSRNVKVGESYEQAKEVILINILNYKMNNKYKEYVSKTVKVLDLHRETEIRTKIKYYYIELPKLEEKEIDIEDELVQWLVYIYGKDGRMIEMVKEKNKMIKEVDEKVRYLQGAEADARMQELRNKWEFEKYCAIADGEERGERRGERRGKKIGKIEIIKNMLKQNVSKENIMKFVGITEMELAEIIGK